MSVSLRFGRQPVCNAVLMSLLVGMAAVFQAAQAGIAPGEIHFAEMNCAACHEAAPNVAQRLASRQSPKLGADGVRISPAWVRDFLLNPQKEKNNAMPDLLHGLPPREKSDAADALTHYLVSLQTAQLGAGTRFDPSLIKEGGELFHKVGCVACHAPLELPTAAAVDFSGDAPKEVAGKSSLVELATNSIPLGNLARKYSVDDLAGFLRDPLKSRPSGRMPSLKLNEGEARAIAMYLLRDQPAPVPQVKIPGLNYEHFEGVGKALPDFSKLKVAATGYATNLNLEGLPRRNSTALRLRAVLTVPQAGDYTLWTVSRDGSQMFIDGKLVVDNDGIHKKPTEKEGKINLTAGDHSLVVTYFHHEGPPVLKAFWAGPGIVKQEIPTTAISLADNGQFMRYADEQSFRFDSAKAAKGQQLFEKLNCAACHEIKPPGLKATPLEKLAGKTEGCLALKTAANVPRFTFTDQQRQELRKFLAALSDLDQPLPPSEQVHRTMTALNCYACHNRAAQGGPVGPRRAYFKVNGAVDLGDEGAIPPHLNGVGAKLKPVWMDKVLTNSASVRPYMATRMPQFGAANVAALPALFVQADASQRSGPELVVESAFVDGLRLVGTEGLSCITCHNFAGHPSLGVPALDITTAPERLNSDWFRRYLLDPAKLRPGTRMPAFWPSGVAANKSILDGDTEKQIAAIWSYLSSAQLKKNLPMGLVASKMELAPKTEPLIYRNFIEGGGSRAIGVGYPEKANLAIDANQMCLALVWHGQFMDASRHWTGRGDGWQPPLGYSVVKFPAGAPFAVLVDEKSVWPRETGKAAGYQFRGYTYDQQRKPTFQYEFGAARISELFQPADLIAKAETGFRRVLTLKAAQPIPNLYFRAAVGESIKSLGNGAYLVDGGLRLAFPRPSSSGSENKIIVRSSEGKTELLVPVNFESGKAEIMEEISW